MTGDTSEGARSHKASKASHDADFAEDQAWQSGDDASDSEQDSCLDAELETDDPEILVHLDGQALTEKLASEVRVTLTATDGGVNVAPICSARCG